MKLVEFNAAMISLPGAFANAANEEYAICEYGICTVGIQPAVTMPRFGNIFDRISK